MTTTHPLDEAAPDSAASHRPRMLLSVEEAADHLSLSRTRIYSLIKTGALTSVRVGRLRRIPAEALGEFVRELVASQRDGTVR